MIRRSCGSALRMTAVLFGHQRTLSVRTEPQTCVQRGSVNCRQDRAAVSRPVGGVLSPARGPGGGHPSTRPTWGHRTGRPSHAWPCSGWGLPSRPGHPGRWCALTAPFQPCLIPSRRAIGGLLSVALSCGSPRLAVSQHPALWSPDLPRQPPARTCRRPPRPPGRLTASDSLARSGGVLVVVRVRCGSGREPTAN